MIAKYEPEEQTVVKPGDTVGLSRGRLECTWASMDDYVNHIIVQMTKIWKHCGFPNGHVCSCRPHINRMESYPHWPTYTLCISTPHYSATTIDWSKAEWTVNIVGKPGLKIKGDSISEHILYEEHVGWIILFYVDVLDVVKPEGKRTESIAIDEDVIMPLSVKEEVAKSVDQKLKDELNSVYGYKKSVTVYMEDILNLSFHKADQGFDLTSLNDTANPAFKYIDTDVAITREMYNIGGNTMNNHEIEVAIRDGGYTDYQKKIIKGFLIRNHILSGVCDIRRDLRPSPKKVIYNGPATIVIFEDGSKTVVKLQEGENMDREKAVYAAICKRMFGSNKNRSNWLDMLKPLMKSADEAWNIKLEKNALNASIKEYSCKMEFDNYEDAAGFIGLIGVLKDKYDKREKTIARILRYPGVSALRKAVKAAREVAKDGKEG